MSPLVVSNKVSIHAPASKVWNVLVNPEFTVKYMFGCEAISDWKQGSALLWKGSYNGQEMVFVKGVILEIIPGVKLKYTVNDPNAAWADVPENYLHVTYSLFEENGLTIFTVVQDGFEQVAEGKKRFDELRNNGIGWQPILDEIKKIAEEI